MNPLEKNELRNDHKVFQIISVGKLHWEAGYSYALDACRILKDLGLKFHYTIVGGAKEIEYLYQIHDLALIEYVTLLDEQEFIKEQEIIKDSNLLLVSNVKESVNNIVLKTMTLGTVVLSTDCGDRERLINDTKNGFLVPVRDAHAMANTIKTIQELPYLQRQSIIHAAQQTVLEQAEEKKSPNSMDLDVPF